MKNLLLTLAVMFLALAGAQAARASNGMRVTYDPHNLNHAVIEVDVVEQCNHKKECTVDVLPGLVLKIKSTIDATVAFGRRNDYSASGLVSQHVPDAELPANPCIESPFPVSHFFWKPAFSNRNRSPSGWKQETGRFTGVSRSGFAMMEVPGTPLHFCIEPWGHFDDDKKTRPLFAVLTLRLEANLGKSADGVVFADTMTRATQVLADRVEDAINNARNLEDDNELLKQNAVPHLRLLISALVGLRVALDPPHSNSGASYPSSADDGIRRAVHVAVRAWSYAAPHLQASTASEPPVSHGAHKEEAIRQYWERLHAFNSSIGWLTLDLETIRSVYGESVTRNFGKSQFVVPLAELLLAELERLRATTTVDAVSVAAPPKDVFEWLGGIQELLIELRDAAFQSGDEAPAIAAGFMPRLAMRWNSASSQKLLDALWESKAKEDLRVFLAFLDTLKKLPAAEKVEFKNIALVRSTSPLGNGGEVRCSVDDGGEYCFVDLLTPCEGRMACSTKLPFGGHSIYLSTRTGTQSLRQPLGTWVRGEEIPVVQAGALLPANPEVCSDLPIVSILYRPTNPKLRWTRDSGGVITGATEFQPERLTVYPPNSSHTFSSRCVVFDAAADEGAYVIQAVRVRINLDKERDSIMRTLMVNASHQFKQDLQEASKSAKVFLPLLPDQEKAIREYCRAIDGLIAELDTSILRYVNRPVTLPDVRAAAANLYVRANLLLSASTGHDLEAQGLMTSLKQVLSQLSLGFGFNRSILSPAELTKEKPMPRKSRDEVIKQLRGLIATTRLYQPVLPEDHRDALSQYTAALGATLKAVEATTKLKHGYDGFPYLMDPAVKTEAVRSVGYASTLIALLQKYPKTNGEIINRFGLDRTLIAATFLPEDPGPDLTHKRAPAIDVLNFALDEGTRYMALKWSDPLYGAASRIQWLLRDELVPAARGPNGDDAVTRSLPKLGRLWAEAEFQLFLVRVGKPSPNIDTVVNQIEKPLGLHLPGLGLILSAR